MHSVTFCRNFFQPILPKHYHLKNVYFFFKILYRVYKNMQVVNKKLKCETD